MRQILAATDFSGRSRRAVKRAAMLARESGARLTLLHVVDDDRDARLVEAEVALAGTALEEMRAELASGVACEARVDRGDPFDGIIRAARDCSAALVVMGEHRRLLLREVFVGTSVERVTRARVAPVLMVNVDPVGPYRRAVLGVDFSEHCAHALHFTRGAAIVAQAELVMAHAFEAMAKGKMNYAGVERAKVAEYVSQVEAQARADLAAFIAANPGHPEPSVTVGEGHPAVVLALAAESAAADLVIVATHGRSAIARMLLGSVTEALMRDLDRDVLAVPPAAR
jgi:nucleotide-binding universal stress UspA family protein